MKNYPPQLKADAVALYESRPEATIRSVAADLGINPETLRNWVRATAKVTRVRWAMGDGTTVTCHGPGTPYAKSRGATPSPDCGHLYERPSYEEPGGRYQGTATAHWTVTWTAPALNDGGTFTETRTTEFTAAVHEVQILNRPGRPLTCRGEFSRGSAPAVVSRHPRRGELPGQNSPPQVRSGRGHSPQGIRDATPIGNFPLSKKGFGATSGQGGARSGMAGERRVRQSTARCAAGVRLLSFGHGGVRSRGRCFRARPAGCARP